MDYNDEKIWTIIIKCTLVSFKTTTLFELNKKIFENAKYKWFKTSMFFLQNNT